ncbi:MAG: GDSL-type esterase/lipase family protein [Candidatus Omnitrophica bacterium]|nr:GDSL-type esterase/lipase family protein [Candidatus Omnitrophota bacterium]
MLNNKKNIIILGIFIIAGLGTFLIAKNVKKEITNRNSGGRNIICFGDSVTFGYGVSPGEDYPTALSRMTARPVINAGADGDTSVEGLGRLKNDVLDKDPYLVLVEFSGNDFIKKVPIDLTMSNIKEMVRQIQGAGAMAAIVDVSAGFFMREYRLRLAKLARETGSIFIPAVLNGILTNPSMKSDFMHPNAHGYKIVAQRVNHAIRPYLKQAQK